MAEETEVALKEGGKGSSMKIVLVMVVGGILLVAVSIGGVFFGMKHFGMLDGGGGGGGHQQPVDPHAHAPAIYFPLEPAFVVNFKDRGRTRFLQVTMEVMARDPQIIEDIQMHMPLIRNNILLLLSNQDAEKLHSSEGKEEIRKTVLEEMIAILAEETGRVKVEGLYFTSFVTQ